ncbi:hypothetical protein [Pseudomonas sp. AAC]|uniref:hypothetical protein n=1 Tax=Pseudomonas sp. AAC TaxID=1502784 RepID=UPI0004D88904|nr:hypothetical protein [Pseudomonas sp. AAC]KES23127.1 hypothetical protein FG99_16355 [Pseudomonas sp. AAC]
MSMTPIDYRTRHPLEDRREQLAGQVEQYLAGGGHITELPGFVERIPFPSRKVVTVTPKPPRRREEPKKHRITIEEEARLIELIKVAAELGQSRTQARETAGIGKMLFMALCFENNIIFPDVAELAKSKSERMAEARRALVPKIEAYAHLGVATCAIRCGVSETTVRKIAREFGITLGVSQ